MRDIKLKQDSLFVVFPTFDSEFRLKIIDKNTLEGRWYNLAKKGNYFIPFKASLSNQPRFNNSPSTLNVDGRWEVTFSYEEDPYKAVGIFQHKKISAHKNVEVVTGTFRTETGDYRFLQGIESGDSLYLSTFDGSHAFLFTAHQRNDSLYGEFFSGNHYTSKWYAVRNDNYDLPHPDSLTYLVSDEPVRFDLPDLDSLVYHFPNEQTKNKVTLIQIMGTWCPNCLDESIFLGELSQTYKESVEIIAVTFETPKTFDERVLKLRKYKDALDLNYTFLLGGPACKSCARDVFPMLNDIISFPTLIFIDKSGSIRKIHTGFNGPGTGVYYEEFKKSTESFLQDLIKE